MRTIFLMLFVFSTLIVRAQNPIIEENDTTTMTEYNDGNLWVYRQLGDYVVGVTNNRSSDDYGNYYQLTIFIKNLGNSNVTFAPELVTSTLYNKYYEVRKLKVYTYERYMKKVRRTQGWAMALAGFSSGLNAGMAGYQTTYTTTYGANMMPYTQVHTTYNHAAAAAANTASQTQMMMLGQMMADDIKTKSQGYIRKTTIHPDEGIIGYMNIKRKKGKKMTVIIPLEDYVFSFDWDLRK